MREGNQGARNLQNRRGRGKKNPNKRGEINIRLLNVNEINKAKFTHLEELFFGEGKGLNILCLTEVKGTYDKIKKGGGLEHFNTFRKKGGKRGGGIQIIMPKSEGINLRKIDNESTEILDLKGKRFNQISPFDP